MPVEQMMRRMRQRRWVLALAPVPNGSRSRHVSSMPIASKCESATMITMNQWSTRMDRCYLMTRDALDSSDADGVAHLEQLKRFAQWLLQLGEGTDPTTDHDTETIALPEDLCLEEGCSLEALVDWVYPDLASNCTNSAWLAGRAILMPKNAEVDRVNAKIAESFPGQVWECLSADAVEKDDDSFAAPTEFLNSLKPSGIPAHKLDLKPNMPIMLLRNLSPADGLCNGTRLLVRRVINGWLLEAEIATGKHRGDVVFIPRIKLSPDESDLPYKWSRRQFPVRCS